MYIVPVEVKESEIDGKGVFATDNIKQTQSVWQFDWKNDTKISKEDFDKLPQVEKEALQRVAYLSPTSNKWVYPLRDNDPACYTNHSNKNNLTAKFDPKFSDEPFFIANRDIAAGEELTNNYKEFDEVSKKLKNYWLHS